MFLSTSRPRLQKTKSFDVVSRVVLDRRPDLDRRGSERPAAVAGTPYPARRRISDGHRSLFWSEYIPPPATIRSLTMDMFEGCAPGTGWTRACTTPTAPPGADSTTDSARPGHSGGWRAVG
jgi:hypothetical protein